MGRYILFVGIVILIFVDVFEMTGAASISNKTEILESNGEEQDGLAAEGGKLGNASAGVRALACGHGGHGGNGGNGGNWDHHGNRIQISQSMC